MIQKINKKIKNEKNNLQLENEKLKEENQILKNENLKLKQYIEKADKNLETYNEFKRKYYIYRVDDILDYLQRDNTELSKLYNQEGKLYKELKENLTLEQQQLLLEYSDNWQDILNEEINGLTQYMLADFEEEK